MEQRAYPRQSLDIEAGFSVRGGTFIPCAVHDYCSGGLYFTFDQSIMQGAPALQLGEMISMELILRDRVLRIEARLVRIIDGAVGVTFYEPDPLALAALQQEAVRQQLRSRVDRFRSANVTPRQFDDAQAKQLLRQYGNTALRALTGSLKHFFEQMPASLIKEAERAANNAEQQQYFDAISIFKSAQDNIERDFMYSIMDHIERLCGVDKRNNAKVSAKESADKLAIVDKSEFEDWLHVKVMASRVESRFRDTLLELQLRLDHLTKSRAGQLPNPVGPAIVANAFRDGLGKIKLKPRVDRVVYRLFEELVLVPLGDTYNDLNDFLRKKGVLENLDLAVYLAGKVISEKNTKQIQQDVLTKLDIDTEAKNDAEVEAQRKAEAAVNSVATPSVAHTASDISSSLKKANIALHSIRSLMSIKAQQRQPEQDAVQNFRPKKELLSALGSLQQGDVDADANNLLHQVKDLLEKKSSDTRPLDPHDEESVEVIDRLFSSILTDEYMRDTARAVVARMRIPLLKVYLMDPGLLSAAEHPARRLLNQIAWLAMDDSAMKDFYLEEVKGAVDIITQEFDQDVQVFDKVLKHLDALVKKHDRLYQRNAARVAQACEGKQRVETARDEVEKTLAKVISGKRIPRALVNLIDGGWRDLLLLVYLREGNDKHSWKTAVIVIETLTQLLSDPPAENTTIEIAPPVILKLIEKGLAKMPTSLADHAKTRNEITALLDMPPETRSQHFEYLDIPVNEFQADSSNLVEKLKAGKTGGSILDKFSYNQALARWMQRTQRMRVGDWLELAVEKNKRIRVRLVWIGTNFSKYVFVNHQGMKVVELSQEDLSTKLQHGDAKILDNADLPLVERSLDEMIKKIYDQLAFEATHDPLTRLPNRKEFERTIERALEDTKARHVSHVACYVDLRQFRLINSSIGYAAGDQLLKDVAKILQDNLTRPGLVARIGGNEFGVYIENCNEEKAYHIISHAEQAIREHRFEWEGQLFKPAVGIGLVVIEEDAVDSASILRAAEASSVLAKEPGRNNIQVYRPDDIELKRRQFVMGWVAKVNRAIDDGTLKLRAQRIEPIKRDKNNTLLPHYEILLGLEDDQGTPMSPGDFIKAAERYDRMHVVDRFVLHNTFEWMQKNETFVKRIGGFSINLSGHSLNDVNFLDYLFEQLQHFNIPREKVIFEVTETSAVANLADASDLISEVKKLGCKFSLDDFGSGLSSYAYVKSLPVDYIKIDGTFVKDILNNKADYAVVKSITEMGHFLGKKVIAEFVENEAIAEVLKEIGVDYLQGYFITPPQAINDLIR